MNIICPPDNYQCVALTIERTGPGTFTLWEYHRHENSVSYCNAGDQYPRLTWDEALDLMATLAEARRPGMHPAGWEQVELALDY